MARSEKNAFGVCRGSVAHQKLGPNGNPCRLPVVEELNEDSTLAPSSLLKADFTEVFQAPETGVDGLSVPAEPDSEEPYFRSSLAG